MPESATASTRPGILAIVLFAVYAALLVGIILFKFPFTYDLTESGRELNLIPFEGSFANPRFGASEVLENVLIFVPLGIYVPMLTRWKVGRTFLVVVAISVVFEALQYAFAIGRADITDVLENGIGGALGIGIYALADRLLHHSASRVITVLALVVTVIAAAFFTFLRLHSK